jgi:5-methylcytosine-specific restriction endonuclease McrA
MSDNSTIEWTDSTGRALGSLKTAARRIGIPFSEYLSMRALGQKWCMQCRGWHLKSAFPIDRSRGDGLGSTCRSRRIRLTQAERRSRANAAYRRYYAGTGGSAIRARVYARKRTTDVIPAIAREMLFEKFGGRCVYCPAAATTLDHMIPVKKGGGVQRGNLLPACRPCNSRKKTMDFDRFIERCSDLHPLIADEFVMAEVM